MLYDACDIFPGRGRCADQMLTVLPERQCQHKDRHSCIRLRIMTNTHGDGNTIQLFLRATFAQTLPATELEENLDHGPFELHSREPETKFSLY